MDSITPSMRAVADDLKRRAMVYPPLDSYATALLPALTVDHDETGTRVIFSRDNVISSDELSPAQEEWLRSHGGYSLGALVARCFHLSLSFYDPAAIAQLTARAYLLGLALPSVHPGATRPYNALIADLWVRAFFDDDAEKLLWDGIAQSEGGIEYGVHHWRLFCDPLWKPIRPWPGEVYPVR